MDRFVRNRKATRQGRRRPNVEGGHCAGRGVPGAWFPNSGLLVVFGFLALLLGPGCNVDTKSAATADPGPGQTAQAPPPATPAGNDQGGDAEVRSGDAVPAPPEGDARVTVTYFHTTFRCPTCTQLETYSRETVERDFATEIGEGRLAFQSVNVQEPENEHFVKEYNLYTKSLVVSLSKSGKEIRWKNLPDIWKHVRDRDRFDQYVREEIQAFLRGS